MQNLQIITGGVLWAKNYEYGSFLVVLGGCVAMTLLTGNGSSGTMIYNFAFLAVMAVIYLAGLFGGMFRVDSIGEALARGTQELSSIFKIPGKAKSEDLSCLKGMFEHKYLDDRMDSFVDAMEKTRKESEMLKIT